MSNTFNLRNLFPTGGIRVGFGTNRLGSLTRKERDRLLSGVWDLGVRHFDTAPLYGSGDAETWLGEFLARRNSGATITTKCGLQPALSQRVPLIRSLARLVRRCGGPLVSYPASLFRKNRAEGVPKVAARSAADYRAIASGMEAALGTSLSKLRREYVDVFAFHEPDPSILQAEEVLAEMEKFKAAGKVRAIAVAGYFDAVLPIGTSGGRPFDVYQFDHDAEGTHIAQWLKAKLAPPILFGALSNSKVSAHRSDGRNRSVSPSSQLRAALAANPEGMVLFSTTKVAHAEELLIPLRDGC